MPTTLDIKKYKQPYKRLGLKLARIKQGYTQQDIANALHWSRSKVANFENCCQDTSTVAATELMVLLQVKDMCYITDIWKLVGNVCENVRTSKTIEVKESAWYDRES